MLMSKTHKYKQLIFIFSEYIDEKQTIKDLIYNVRNLGILFKPFRGNEILFVY